MTKKPISRSSNPDKPTPRAMHARAINEAWDRLLERHAEAAVTADRLIAEAKATLPPEEFAALMAEIKPAQSAFAAQQAELRRATKKGAR